MVDLPRPRKPPMVLARNVPLKSFLLKSFLLKSFLLGSFLLEDSDQAKSSGERQSSRRRVHETSMSVWPSDSIPTMGPGFTSPIR